MKDDVSLGSVPSLSTRPIRVILFDLGGVLVELTGVSTLLSWTESLITPEIVWKTWLSSPAVRQFETGRLKAEIHSCDTL
jgi:hypothetical protein